MLIAVSSWSFHADLYAGNLHLSDMPFRAYDLGYRAVELQDLFFVAASTGPLTALVWPQGGADCGGAVRS